MIPSCKCVARITLNHFSIELNLVSSLHTKYLNKYMLYCIVLCELIYFYECIVCALVHVVSV